MKMSHAYIHVRTWVIPPGWDTVCDIDHIIKTIVTFDSIISCFISLWVCAYLRKFESCKLYFNKNMIKNVSF